MFHVELRQTPHMARSFNLSAEQLQSRIVEPWVRGEEVVLDGRRWPPNRAKLTIYEGPELRTDELGLGRGWGNVTRKGEDVTARVIEAATQTVRPPGPMSHVPAFKHELTELSAERPIAVRDALALANDRYPGWRVSDRIALAEQAVWELLHEGGLRLVRPAGEDRYEATTREEWGPLLLAWATWCDPHPQAYLAAARPD